MQIQQAKLEGRLECRQGEVVELKPGHFERKLFLLIDGEIFCSAAVEWEGPPLSRWDRFKARFAKSRGGLTFESIGLQPPQRDEVHHDREGRERE